MGSDIVVEIDGGLEYYANLPDMASSVMSKLTGLNIQAPVALVGAPLDYVVLADTFYSNFTKIAQVAGT